MANFGFIIDNRRCIGCHACTVACKSEHSVPVGVNRTWVKYIEKGEFPNSRRLFSVMRCNHCDNAPCVTICPVTALYTRSDGIVDFDSRRCIGCKACMQACPYDALYIDPETHTAAKCNYCAHRIDQGLEPACVNVCPTQAIISGDLDEPNSRISLTKSRNAVTARKTEKGTEPALWYINADQDSLDPVLASDIQESLWGSQVAGVGHHAPDARHPLDAIGSLLGLGEVPKFRDAGDDALRPPRTHRTEPHLGQSIVANAPQDHQARRAYDAPQKGVLWGWQVSSYLWTKAIAAGVTLICMLLWLFSRGTTFAGGATHQASALVSLVFLGLTGMLLVADLDQPRRFLYVLLRPQWKSWLVRGAWIITAFSGLLAVCLVWNFFGNTEQVRFGPPRILLAVLLVALSAATGVYTAFLFAQAKGRDAWQSPLLAVQMLLHTLLAGVAGWLLMNSAAGERLFSSRGNPGWLVLLGIVLLVLHLGTELLHLAIPHPTESAHQAASIIRQGRLRWHFWIGSVLVGCVAPLVLLLVPSTTTQIIAAVLMLAGIYVSQHVSVFAPQQLPLS